MSQTDAGTTPQKYEAGAATVDMKLEVVVIPVSDVERDRNLLEPDACLLSKPFTRDALLHKLRDVLAPELSLK